MKKVSPHTDEEKKPGRKKRESKSFPKRQRPKTMTKKLKENKLFETVFSLPSLFTFFSAIFFCCYFLFVLTFKCTKMNSGRHKIAFSALCDFQNTTLFISSSYLHFEFAYFHLCFFFSGRSNSLTYSLASLSDLNCCLLLLLLLLILLRLPILFPFLSLPCFSSFFNWTLKMFSPFTLSYFLSSSFVVFIILSSGREDKNLFPFHLNLYPSFALEDEEK